MKRDKRVWDWPVRLCHWSIVLLVSAQWITIEFMDDAIEWHAWFGYVLLGIIVFRIIWGFIGTRYAKFGEFIASPKTCYQYLRDSAQGSAKVYTGHNPLGGWMALLLLLLILAQAITGLFMTDDIFFSAPYYDAIDSDLQSLMSTIHHQAFTALQIAILLHVLAALVYVVFKKQPLIRALLTGKKPTDDPENDGKYWVKALLLALVVAGLVYMLIFVWAPPPADDWMY